MKKSSLLGAVCGCLICLISSSANAVIVNAPLPSNTFITINGLDWAWASPLPASSSTTTGFDLS